jgi:chemotaxis protein methyltransferase CheR
VSVLTSQQFERIAETAHRLWGLSMPERKIQLVSSRMSRFLRGRAFDSVDAYLHHLETAATDKEKLEFFDVLSTNTTSFFREMNAFNYLERELWTPLSRGTLTTTGRRIRIWSAASSTGEEPYSIVMHMREHLAGDWDFRLLASDLARSVLVKAKRGVYTDEAVASVPEEMRKRWFTRTPEGWRVADEIRRPISYRMANLVEPFRFKGPFDVIFCRNVMIYFDRQTREDIVNRLGKLLRPGGALILGSSESLSGIQSDLHPVQPSVYVR